MKTGINGCVLKIAKEPGTDDIGEVVDEYKEQRRFKYRDLPDTSIYAKITRRVDIQDIFPYAIS